MRVGSADVEWAGGQQAVAFSLNMQAGGNQVSSDSTVGLMILTDSRPRISPKIVQIIHENDAGASFTIALLSVTVAAYLFPHRKLSGGRDTRGEGAWPGSLLKAFHRGHEHAISLAIGQPGN